MTRARPTGAEWEILAALWDLGRPATVREVHLALGAQTTRYTTTLKLMQIMTEKGLLLRDERDRAHLYKARFKRESMQSDAAADMLNRMFAGSAADLMQRALARRKPTNEELRKLREMIDKFEREDR